MAEQHSGRESRLAYSLHQFLWNLPDYLVSTAQLKGAIAARSGANLKTKGLGCLWRYGDCLRRKQCVAWFRIKACIHELLMDAALTDMGIEYIAKETPAGFSRSNKSHSECAAD
jgi:hypothetical protein